MHPAIPELVLVGSTEATPNMFPPEVGEGPPQCAQRGRTGRRGTRQLKSVAERTLIRAMTAAESSLNFSEHIGLGIVYGEDYSNYVLDREEFGILSPRACRRKQLEFASGRAAAHFALNQIGFSNPFPILRGPKGEPLWPERIAGSITHCYPWSVAVAVKCPNLPTIGVDLETTERVQGTDISELVCGDTELDWVHSGNSLKRLAMIFSAKEAVYKAFYPRCKRYIDFKDVELTWVAAQSCFQGEFLASFGPDLSRGQTCAVYCHSYAELVFSCVIHRCKKLSSNA